MLRSRLAVAEPFPDDANEEGEEVAQPNLQNAPANPVEAIPPEPDLDSVKDVLRNRLLVHRLGQRHATVSDAEIYSLVRSMSYPIPTRSGITTETH